METRRQTREGVAKAGGCRGGGVVDRALAGGRGVGGQVGEQVGGQVGDQVKVVRISCQECELLVWTLCDCADSSVLLPAPRCKETVLDLE